MMKSIDKSSQIWSSADSGCSNPSGAVIVFPTLENFTLLDKFLDGFLHSNLIDIQSKPLASSVEPQMSTLRCSMKLIQECGDLSLVDTINLPSYRSTLFTYVNPWGAGLPSTKVVMIFYSSSSLWTSSINPALPNHSGAWTIDIKCVVSCIRDRASAPSFSSPGFYIMSKW